MKQKNNLRVLSLGAGVQSSALALMIEKGEVPMVDAGIFADVKGEPKAVYDWLAYLKTQITKFPIYTVSKNTITGKKRMLLRQCTGDYKIKPVVQKVRELIGLKKGEKRKKGTKVEMLMGISKDEIFRMKTNPIKYIQNAYPLVDKNLRRQDCLDWLKKNGYPKAPRSACTFCPFHSLKEWKEIKKNKEEWNEVVEMDKAIRKQERFKNKDEFAEDELFLHSKCIPIDEIDFDKEDAQMDFFYGMDNECEGMCGN